MRYTVCTVYFKIKKFDSLLVRKKRKKSYPKIWLFYCELIKFSKFKNNCLNSPFFVYEVVFKGN